jgi:hypothetical protein
MALARISVDENFVYQEKEPQDAVCHAEPFRGASESK